MKIRTFLYAWVLIIGLAIVAVLIMSTDLKTGLLLLIPLLLWVGLVRLQHAAVWWMLSVLNTALGIYYMYDFVMNFTGNLTPGVIVTVTCASLLFLLSDFPQRWNTPRDIFNEWLTSMERKHALVIAAAPVELDPTEEQKRQDFLLWWNAKEKTERITMWERLTSQEQHWASDGMSSRERKQYASHPLASGISHRDAPENDPLSRKQ